MVEQKKRLTTLQQEVSSLICARIKSYSPGPKPVSIAKMLKVEKYQ